MAPAFNWTPRKPRTINPVKGLQRRTTSDCWTDKSTGIYLPINNSSVYIYTCALVTCIPLRVEWDPYRCVRGCLTTFPTKRRAMAFLSSRHGRRGSAPTENENIKCEGKHSDGLCSIFYCTSFIALAPVCVRWRCVTRATARQKDEEKREREIEKKNIVETSRETKCRCGALAA